MSWIKAAVFSLNRAIAGTPSQRITADARSIASAFLSLNVPSTAYTSIIGTAVLLASMTVVIVLRRSLTM